MRIFFISLFSLNTKNMSSPDIADPRTNRLARPNPIDTARSNDSSCGKHSATELSAENPCNEVIPASARSNWFVTSRTVAIVVPRRVGWSVLPKVSLVAARWTLTR